MNILDGPGSLQERLASAFRTELQYVGPEGLDERLVNILEMINDELTKVEADGDKDTFDMSAENMTDYEAQNLANQIRDIYRYLGEHYKISPAEMH
jgi:hypothetical protein